MARLQPPAFLAADSGITLPAPLRIVNAAGAVVLELAADADGGLLCVNSAKGEFRVLLGSGPEGGWVDVIGTADARLGVTLYATDEGGVIEHSHDGAAYLVVGERYGPPDGVPEHIAHP